MKNIIIVACVVLCMSSCGKKHCYQCSTIDYSQAGINQNVWVEKCMTEKQKDKYVKDHTVRHGENPNLVGPNDIITECK